jgi:cupin 2 domain-containing protein
MPSILHGDLGSNMPADVSALPEQIAVLVEGKRLRVERIVSQGHRSPDGFWYDQSEDEFVLLIAGSARLDIEGKETLELRPGAWVFIPAHVRHRVEWTDPALQTTWLAVFCDDGPI